MIHQSTFQPTLYIFELLIDFISVIIKINKLNLNYTEYVHGILASLLLSLTEDNAVDPHNLGIVPQHSRQLLVEYIQILSQNMIITVSRSFFFRL
jgi:hypothetical protein